MKKDNCYAKTEIDDLLYIYQIGTNKLKTIIDSDVCNNIETVGINDEGQLRTGRMATHKAQKQVISEVDLSNKNKTFEAGERVTLNPGFKHNGTFSGIIQDCNLGFNGVGNSQN